MSVHALFVLHGESSQHLAPPTNTIDREPLHSTQTTALFVLLVGRSLYLRTSSYQRVKGRSHTEEEPLTTPHLWVNGLSFFHCVASPFHSFVTTDNAPYTCPIMTSALAL